MATVAQRSHQSLQAIWTGLLLKGISRQSQFTKTGVSTYFLKYADVDVWPQDQEQSGKYDIGRETK